MNKYILLLVFCAFNFKAYSNEHNSASIDLTKTNNLVVFRKQEKLANKRSRRISLFKRQDIKFNNGKSVGYDSENNRGLQQPENYKALDKNLLDLALYSDRVLNDFVYSGYNKRFPEIIYENTTGYQILKEEIRRLAFYAFIMNLPTESISSWTCVLCERYDKLEHLKVFENQSQFSKGLVGVDKSNGEILAIFKGSDIQNYKLHNLSHKKSAIYDKDLRVIGYTKSGYLNYSLNFDNEFFNYLNELHIKYPSYEIIFSGQSLGAVCSVLVGARARLEQKINKDIKIYPLSMPVFSDKDFTKWIDENLNILAIYNVNDVLYYESTQNGLIYPRNKILILKESNPNDTTDEKYIFRYCKDNSEICKPKEVEIELIHLIANYRKINDHLSILGVHFNDYGNPTQISDWTDILLSAELRSILGTEIESLFWKILNIVRLIS